MLFIDVHTTVKPVLSNHSKIDKTKIFYDKWYLNEGRKYCRMLPLLQNAPRGAFCNTFDLHQVIIGHGNQFFVFFLSGRLRQVLL